MRFYFLFILLLIHCNAPAFARSIIQSSAKQAMVIDAQTGQVLFEKNAKKRMPTSSMSKVMTMYMIFEALEDGRLSLDTTLPVSEKAWKKGGSKMFVEVGKRIKVEDLIRGVIIQSGNDATIVLAEGLAGSEEAFALAMTEKAHALGMKNSNFKNASGWPDSDHYSTAEDLALLATRLISDYPQYYRYYAETEFSFNNIKQPNRNPLLYRNIGADGIKTGHTEIGGYGLMASAVKNGRRVIMVVNGLETEKERAQESARLMEWALRSFENLTLFKGGEIIETAPVILGKEKSIPLILENDLIVTVPRINRHSIKIQLVHPTPLEAPLAKGQEIGHLNVAIPHMNSIQRTVITGKSVQQVGFISQLFKKLILLVTGGPKASHA